MVFAFLTKTMTIQHFSQDGEVIAQGFGFTGDFLDEGKNSVYCQVQKIACRFKELARIRHSCEKCGLSVINFGGTPLYHWDL